MNIGTVRQQQFENLQMTECDGQHQRQVSVVIDRINVGASSQQ